MCHPADPNGTAGCRSGDAAVGAVDVEVAAAAAEIEVGISDGTAASIDVNSERGAVRNSVASPESTDAPDATAMIHARTRHGDIIIQRAAH